MITSTTMLNVSAVVFGIVLCFVGLLSAAIAGVYNERSERERDSIRARIWAKRCLTMTHVAIAMVVCACIAVRAL